MKNSAARKQLSFFDAEDRPLVRIATDPLASVLPGIALAIRCFRGDVFHAWCLHAWHTDFNHGSKLIDMLGTPTAARPGLTDSVHAAEKLLKEAEIAGWILRSANASPSHNQRFFGVGGSDIKQAIKSGAHPSLYGFTPIRECASFRTWLEHPSHRREDPTR